MKQDNENVTYASPAIERRENVSGLLGSQEGSYCPPVLN
jgi:hypothetical protein